MLLLVHLNVKGHDHQRRDQEQESFKLHKKNNYPPFDSSRSTKLTVTILTAFSKKLHQACLLSKLELGSLRIIRWPCSLGDTNSPFMNEEESPAPGWWQQGLM